MTTFIGTPADETFDGTDGIDNAFGAGGNDTLNGNGGPDRLEGGNGADNIFGGVGDDLLFSDIRAGSTWFSLDAGSRRDNLFGGDGNDFIAAGYRDTVDGGTGQNTLSMNFQDAPEGVHADFLVLRSGGSITIGGGSIANISGLRAIDGSALDDYIVAWGVNLGHSVVHGNGGSDELIADEDIYELYGDDGDDVLSGTGDLLSYMAFGGAGNDEIHGSTYTECHGDDGDDVIDDPGIAYGGAGNDIMRSEYSGLYGGVHGDDGDDVIAADPDVAAPNRMYGGGGGDQLNGYNDNDELFSDGEAPDGLDTGLEHDVLLGGTGDDVLSVGYGDNVDGGDGIDTLSMVWERAAEGIDLKTRAIVDGPFAFGSGVIQNVEVLHTISTTDNDDRIRVAPQAGILTVYLNGGNDRMSGSGAAMAVDGGDGSDKIVCSAAEDVLDGGLGDDWLVGGDGRDRMSGGAGADRFAFNAVSEFGGATKGEADRILDFDEGGGDVIVLRRIDAVAGDPDDPFSFIGTSAFGGTAGQLRYEHVTGDTLVTGDIDGDATADFMIVLFGIHALTADDFSL